MMTSLHRTPGVRGLVVGMRLAPKKGFFLEMNDDVHSWKGGMKGH